MFKSSIFCEEIYICILKFYFFEEFYICILKFCINFVFLEYVLYATLVSSLNIEQ